MENSLWDLLSNGQSVDKVVTSMLDANLTDSQISQHLIQLLVNCCGLDYNITEELASNVYEHPELVDDLGEMDFNHQESILYKRDIDLRGFFLKLFCVTQRTPIIEGEWFVDTSNFLRLILENEDLPDDSVLKVVCAFINALLLIPLSRTYIYMQKKNDTSDKIKNIMSFLAGVLKFVFSNIQQGFRYESICVQVAQEFTDAMEKFAALFVNKINYLYKYERLLENHNEAINTKALTSLQILCNNESIHEQLEAFFLSENVKELLKNLVLYKKRKITLAVVELQIKLKNFMDDQILPENITDHLLLEVFSPVAKQSRQAAKLIVDSGQSLWQTVVNLFARYENDLSKLKLFINNIFKWNDSFDISIRLELIVNNLQDKHKACIAAHIFVLLLEKYHTEDPGSDLVIEVIREYSDHISRIETVPEAVGIILSFFLDISSESLENASSTAIITELTRLGITFDSFWPLRRVNSSIGKMYLQFEDADDLIKSLKLKLLQNFEAVTDEFFQGIPVNIGPSTLQLMLFIEQPSLTQLFDEGCLTRLLILMQRLFEEIDVWGPNDLSLLLGLNTSIFKQFWIKFKNQEVVTFNKVDFSTALIHHVDRLFLMMNVDETDFKFLDAMIIFVNALELAIYFQLNISYSIPNPVFPTANFSLSTQRMRILFKFLETYLFCKKMDPETDAGFVEKKTMLDMWLIFNESYIEFPSKTSSGNIIRYYGLENNFTSELEELVEILQTKQKGAFTQSVAVAILIFSREDQFAGFKKFWQNMVKLIIAYHNKDMVAVGVTILLIAISIMKQLLLHMENCANNSNRLAILDYVVYFMKDYRINNRASLITDAFQNLGKRTDLLTSERASFENFKEKMR